MKMSHWQSGDRVRFDPSLSVVVAADGLFKTTRVSGRIDRVNQLALEDSAGSFPVWHIEADDGSAFMLVEDQPANLWFLLRLMGESRHGGGMPEWLEQDDYSVSLPSGQSVPFGFYSPPLLARMETDNLLLRIYVRTTAEAEEFLWILLKNDVVQEYWVGIVIDPAQILPGQAG
ncbi:hypothetical protein FJZ55_04105 [Candidatus Woesearchaeota archaeon]|nr:hypothetical protein [Candidatus Woesearchaeota archaeon]